MIATAPVSPEDSTFTQTASSQPSQTVSGLRAPVAGNRLSSSISVPRANRPPSTIVGNSGSTTSLTSSTSKIQTNTQSSRSKSLALGGLKTPTSGSSNKISPTSSGSDTSPTSSTQSSSTKSRLSSTNSSNSKLSAPNKNGLKYSGQLSSLKSTSVAGSGNSKISSIPARRSSSSRPNSRPTSTVMDGNGSQIPGSNSPKPTAAVKGIVTGSNTSIPSRTNGANSPQDKKKQTKTVKSEVSNKKEEDSSSSNGSDIEAALAQLEPMAPIQRPTNYGYLKSGNCGNTLPVRRNIDDTDNSER